MLVHTYTWGARKGFVLGGASRRHAITYLGSICKCCIRVRHDENTKYIRQAGTVGEGRCVRLVLGCPCRDLPVDFYNVKVRSMIGLSSGDPAPQPSGIA